MKTFSSASPRSTILALIFVLNASISAAPASDTEFDSRGRQFIGFSSFSQFVQGAAASNEQTSLTSPQIHARIRFNEVVLSWNGDVPAEGYLTVEAKAVYPDRSTKYYTLGIWSTSSKEHGRASVSGQKDSDGDVATDTLALRHPADDLQIRLTLGGSGAARPRLKFLGISLADTNFTPRLLPPDHSAWGKVLAVPERTQMIYPNGKTLCSPTTVSMLLGYWAEKLKRAELDQGVPKVAESIYDAEWHGTGNWAFNVAYAGSFPGMKAYVSRFSDVSELEAWVARDIPVGLSVDYDRLRAKGPGPNGHIVACVGFTENGDPIINDPGTTEHVRKIFSRKNLMNAWACSRNTVYLLYPETASPPSDRFGHWDSETSRIWDPFSR